MLGMKFPAGEEMDGLALVAKTSTKLLTTIKVKDSLLNLSGIDTQMKRVLDDLRPDIDNGELIRELFEKIAEAMFKMVAQGADRCDIKKVLMAGGVCSSRFIKHILTDKFEKAGIEAAFDDTDLSQDNAVGISLLGGKTYGIETC